MVKTLFLLCLFVLSFLFYPHDFRSCPGTFSVWRYTETKVWATMSETILEHATIRENSTVHNRRPFLSSWNLLSEHRVNNAFLQIVGSNNNRWEVVLGTLWANMREAAGNWNWDHIGCAGKLFALRRVARSKRMELDRCPLISERCL